MLHPRITGEFGVVKAPEIAFSKAGKPWARIRVVAKDRQQDGNGVWSDADEYFLDVIAFGNTAENVIESIWVGDIITVSGALKVSVSEKDGVKYTNVQIKADYIGASLTMQTAKTARMVAKIAEEGGEPAALPAEDVDPGNPF